MRYVKHNNVGRHVCICVARLDQIEGTFRALGKKVEVRVESRLKAGCSLSALKCGANRPVACPLKLREGR